MQDPDSRDDGAETAPNDPQRAAKKPSAPAKGRAEAREEKLAAALRANLRRRKAGRVKVGTTKDRS